MNVSLDYDNTFTADPTAWKFVVAALRARGHAVICVTARHDSEDNRRELGSSLPFAVPIVFAGDESKEVAAVKHGYLIDVWIDDHPERVKTSYFRSPLKLSKPHLVGGRRR